MNLSHIISSSSNDTQVLDLIYFGWCENNTTGPFIWAGIAGIVYLLGFPASLIVFCELFQRQRQRASNEIFMLNIAVIDLSFTAFIPFGLCNFMIWHNLPFQWITNFLYSLILTGRPLFMACICGDSYVAVVHPITYMTNKKFSTVKKVISVIIWIIIVVYGLVICYLVWVILTPLTSLPLVIALPVIAFCDISIFHALRKPDPSGKSYMHPQKKRAFYTILASFVMTFTAYLPPAVIFSFGILIENTQIGQFCKLVFYGTCFTMTGCVIMPLLYLDSVGKLETFKEWWKQLNSFFSQ